MNSWSLKSPKSDLVEAGLVRGVVGTVALVHGNQKGFEVKFVNAGGRTIAVETLTPNQIRKIEQDQAILHVSQLR